ncbi:cytochrome P450 [Ganoderma sinense ZZ0214-1]|uniref:Cytochrome P450 n=1 Tax=Ganoderma sinense ZZ0214-1 TaxID=1077348 RepID=A0A2G8RQ19_9APHY|nr:cytochrome P450 [Ganoderma sinense ZZ0214-1]
MSLWTSSISFARPSDFVPTFLRLAVLLSGIIIALSLLRRTPQDKAGNVVPPGPKGFPVLGVFLYLSKYPELSLHKWAKQYGSIYSFMIGDQRFVILSDPNVVKDILVTNGAIFSSRKEMFLKVQTILVHRGITASGYNETWRKHRRIAAKILTARAVATYTPAIEFEAKEMIRTLLVDGKAGAAAINPQPYASRFALNNNGHLRHPHRIHGVRPSRQGGATYLARVHQLIYHSPSLARNVTGAVSNAVDFFPLLRRFPNRMTSRAKKLHQDILDFNSPYLADIEARLKRGDDVPDCQAKTLLLTREEEELDDLDIIIMCGTLIIGGVETTASIQQWFAAHIAGCPDIQEKAQAELDRVCGRDRLPNADDEKDLPYLRAIAKEVARFHNPFWLGTPHMSTEDFAYRGSFIPKDTVVIGNTWTMHRDPMRHPDPYTFNPDRYANDKTPSADSAHLPDVMERDHWSFGIGRRICPGVILAEREVFLGLAHMLWAFKIAPIPGVPIDLKEYDGVSGCSPVPFVVRLTPRDASVAEVLGL